MYDAKEICMEEYCEDIRNKVLLISELEENSILLKFSHIYHRNNNFYSLVYSHRIT